MNGQDSNKSTIRFRINGKAYTVRPGEGDNSHPKSVLLDYIRNDAGLTGTKYMCREGGCGACVCVVSSRDPGTGKCVTRSVNSCLLPVFACDGLDICTVEGLGNSNEGYDLIQNRMVGFSGTQCGFCSPGWVMSMHGLMKSKGNLTAEEIENAMDGNICRCTGYRPIMDAFKSLATDAPESIKKRCTEFEEVAGKRCPLKEGCCKAGKCLKEQNPDIENCFVSENLLLSIDLAASGQQWLKPRRVDEILDVLRQCTADGVKYRLIAGNTSTGIFKSEPEPRVYIDINSVPELRSRSLPTGAGAGGESLQLGGNVTLSAAIDLLREVHSSEVKGYEYLADLAKHWARVANVPLRNAATIAGNLMVKHVHREFPSDVFLTLAAINGKLRIASVHKANQELYTLSEFLDHDMTGCLILSIHFPKFATDENGRYFFRSFKISKRYQNAHAYVNAAMVFKVDVGAGRDFVVTEKPSICFGGIHPLFVHAERTESFLVGKSLLDKQVLKESLDILDTEIVPDYRVPDASPEYRRDLARNLLYKTMLGIIRPNLHARHASGALDLERKLMSGKQVYDYRREDWPVSQPIPKLEAAIQCSGEAEYVNDIQAQKGELFGAFVYSTVSNATLSNIDPSEALELPGVVAFICAKDIPGVNCYMRVGFSSSNGDDEVFVAHKITSAGLPLGVILAESRDAAFAGVKLVRVTYTDVRPPILTIKEAMAAAKANGTYDSIFAPPSKGNPPIVAKSKYNISGEIELGGQHHFPLETQSAICIPKEGGIEIYSATQWVDHVQSNVAAMLNVDTSNITVQVRRIGGAFGSKIARATLVACAAALGAYVTNRPVRIILDLETNLNMYAKRPPYWGSYEVGFDDTGKIENLKVKIVSDNGCNSSEQEIMNAVPFVQNVYDSTGWEVIGGNVQTNTPSNTYCRAPGTTQGIAMIEMIMEHIAHHLRRDPLEVRLNNLIKDGGVSIGFPFANVNGDLPQTIFKGENMIPKLLEDLRANADFEKRKKSVEEFNKANRWTKRGLSIVPMKYYEHLFSIRFPVFIAIHRADGSVSISHGGIEMGQGINTKAVQAVAYSLQIPMDRIKVKPTNGTIAANGMCTCAAIGSELVCFAAVEVCKILKERMAPVRARLPESASWEELITACYTEGIDLRATYQPKPGDDVHSYCTWGLTATEVEVDVLTGEFKIARVDLIEDAGKSISPEVDIGQVEGAFVMGLGLWTLERIEYDKETGQLLTNNTWEYKVPFAKDIPEDFRVTLLRDAPNPLGVLGSKATGEPPLCMSIGVVLALKNAIDSARQDAGNYDHYQINTPITPESVLRYSLTSKEHLQLD